MVKRILTLSRTSVSNKIIKLLIRAGILSLFLDGGNIDQGDVKNMLIKLMKI